MEMNSSLIIHMEGNTTQITNIKVWLMVHYFFDTMLIRVIFSQIRVKTNLANNASDCQEGRLLNTTLQ